MSKKYFSYDEVNDLIPQLEHHFRQLILDKKEMSKAAQRLKRAGLVPELLGEIPAGLNEENAELYRRVQNHYRDFKRHALAIEDLGGEIQDFELGRIVFYSMEGATECRLVWQLGVTDEVHREVGLMSPAPERRREKIAAGSFF